jgi:hypothetical protein
MTTSGDSYGQRQRQRQRQQRRHSNSVRIFLGPGKYRVGLGQGLNLTQENTKKHAKKGLGQWKLLASYPIIPAFELTCI